VRFLSSRSYEWVVEGDIKACFDEISHPALIDRVRQRIGDRRVLGPTKAFLKADIFGEDRRLRTNQFGTPQGSILSPLLSNVALSVLDEFVTQHPGGSRSEPWRRCERRAKGLPNCRLVRYADDWCLLVAGTRSDAEQFREQAAVLLCGMGLRLSPEKTLITHIDEGLDFLGWRIQRHRKTGHRPVLRLHLPGEEGAARHHGQGQDGVPGDKHGSAARRPAGPADPGPAGVQRPFQVGVSSATFSHLHHYTWHRVWRWIRKKHRKTTWKALFRRYGDVGRWPVTEAQRLFDPATMGTKRYRYRGAKIPNPWLAAG
jgi:RNA-directed DNA polymerase